MLPITNHPLYKKHDIDSAMNSFWEFYKSRFLSLFLISFVMSIFMQYGSTFLNFNELINITDPAIILEKIKDSIVPILVISLVSLLFSNILYYYILVKPLDSSKNILVSILESLKYFVPYLIILIILAFFGSFAIAAGLMVFIIGVLFSFVYLMMISFFILPVMMSEGINIGHTIQRVAKLSHRNFWNNIGWTSVFLILLIVITLIFSAVIKIPFTVGSLKTIFNPDAGSKILDMMNNPIFIVLSSVVNALTFPLMPIFGFIIYFNSRAREEVARVPSYGDEDYKVRVEDLYSKPIQEDEKDDEGTKRLRD